ncbi:SAV_6107 family HEPN domain-containing protein [Allobranchiibius sp. GilTou73]|uniref:SAV_6107 family HEPN domain-containing protein n=1 Tax=Allobranchiibius sp. GilTou73 TaxID=2904523 RepID=UPI001F3DBB4A|nr:SAV_6107 family HEPN domain-containing protein [Allobranchiibius sp. GilTou73]UIJ33614.1 hypothetical protein LVQ62_10585 [Allobranchiibius sp. GilTou73]
MPSTSTMPITPDAPTLSRPARSPAPRSVPPAAHSAGGASSVAVLELVDRAREALLEACHSNGTTERYALAQLGALRAATALVANRISTRRGSARRDVWTTLVAGVPELTEWAEFFAVTSARGSERGARAGTSDGPGGRRSGASGGDVPGAGPVPAGAADVHTPSGVRQPAPTAVG